MVDLHGARLILHAVDAAEAERIAARKPGPADSWAADFPFEGDVIGATTFLRAMATRGDPTPFGHYVIIRGADGQVIGGIGFKGQPEAGCVEIGYGLAPSARGLGYVAEAARTLLDLAREHGLSRVVADTDRDNIPSQRTLEHAGFTRIGIDGELYLYEIILPDRHQSLGAPFVSLSTLPCVTAPRCRTPRSSLVPGDSNPRDDLHPDRPLTRAPHRG